MRPPVAGDARVFLTRLARLDAAALVRLRPDGSATRTELWARLPWGVLVTRAVDGAVASDRTVAATALLAADDRWPPGQDDRWRWPLPAGSGQVLESLPAGRVGRLASAAADTLRQVTAAGVGGRPVGVRTVRDALLDHLAVVVEAPAGRIGVPLRVVQAVVRMGFLGDGDDPVRVRRSGRWVGLAARFGTAWLPPTDPLTLRPVPRRPG